MSHPRNIKMMYGHGSLLRVYACAKHGGGAKQHTHIAVVHVLYHALSRPLTLGCLYELYLACGYAQFHQLCLYVAVDVPLVGLVGGKVGKDELRTFVCCAGRVVFIDSAGADACLVCRVIAELAAKQAHIESHFAGYVGCHKHLALVKVFGRGRVKSKVCPISAVSELHQPLYHRLLLCRGCAAKKTHILLGHIKVYHFRCAVVGNLAEESCQLGHFDVAAKTLLAAD